MLKSGIIEKYVWTRVGEHILDIKVTNNEQEELIIEMKRKIEEDKNKDKINH